MKIDYISDLHINHWVQWTVNQLKWEKRTREFTKKLLEKGNGEVLIIAGDFSEWNDQSLWVLDQAAKQYKRIYFTFGNHDLYLLSKKQKKKYGDSLGRLKEFIDRASEIENVVPLIKRVDVYEGKTFAGDVMWYLPKTFEDWQFFKGVSNDSNFIHINGYSQEEATMKLWKDSMSWYDGLENTHIDVFVSHVPPVHNPFTPYKSNSLYLVDLPFMNANHWICGHSHMQGSFEKVGVHFHMNALGYSSEYQYKNLDEIFSGEKDGKKLGVKTFEI